MKKKQPHDGLTKAMNSLLNNPVMQNEIIIPVIQKVVDSDADIAIEKDIKELPLLVDSDADIAIEKDIKELPALVDSDADITIEKDIKELPTLVDSDANIAIEKDIKELPALLDNSNFTRNVKSIEGAEKDSITLFIYEELKYVIDQHVINFDIKYNSFYTNVINSFYEESPLSVFDEIDEDKSNVKVRIICNKEDKKNIRLFAKENKISLRQFFTTYIKHYLKIK